MLKFEVGHVAIRPTRRGVFAYNVNDSVMAYSLENYGQFAEDELKLLTPYIKQDAVVLDVGANIGTHTVPFARLCPRGVVLPFEPQLCNYLLLCTNVALAGVTNVLPQLALMGRDCQTVKIPQLSPHGKLNYGAVNALELVAEKHEHGMDMQQLSVDSMKLSRCDLIKIDVEGGEPEILAGATETIASFKPVIYAECNDTSPEIAEKTAAALVPVMRGLPGGYRLFWHINEFYRADNFYGSTQGVEGHDRNVLALPPDAPVPEGVTEIPL